MRIRRKRLMVDLILAMVGYVIGCAIVLHWSHTRHASQAALRCAGQRSAAEGGPGTLTVTDDTVMIGILTTRANLATRATTVYSTWGREVSGLVVFYVGQGDTSKGDTSTYTDISSEDHTEGEDPVSSEEHRQETMLSLQAEPFSNEDHREGQEARPSLQAERVSNEDHREGEETRPLVQAEPLSSEDHRGLSLQDEPVRVIHGLPVVELVGVKDDDYPPRAKSFAMLRHMLRHFGPHFHWFVRADDDLYIRSEELVKFLKSLDSSRPWYIGRPGFGNPKERGNLGLDPGKPYCMGGPGVVFSALSLRLLVPWLPTCADRTVSSHEDTELGRCVLQHLNLSCFNDKRIKNLFYADYGKDSLAGSMKDALTWHPAKDPQVVHKLHMYFNMQRLTQLHTRQQTLQTEIKHMNMGDVGEGVGMDNIDQQTQRLIHSLSYDRQKNAEDFVAEKISTGRIHSNSVDDNGREPLPHNQRDTKDGTISRDQPRVPASVTMENAQPVTVEVLMENNPVWNYAVFDRAYTPNPPVIRSSHVRVMKNAWDQLNDFTKVHHVGVLERYMILAKYQTYTLTHGMQHIISLQRGGGYQSFIMSSKFGPLQWLELDEHTLGKVDGHRKTKSSLGETRAFERSRHRREAVPSHWPDLHVLLPLSGRHQSYVRFLQHLATSANSYHAKVHLRVALYADSLQEHTQSLRTSSQQWPMNVTVVKMHAQFSRAIALNTLTEGFEKNEVLIFIDVDLVITQQFLFRVASNVKPGTAFFPTMFSKYSPETVCYGRRNCTTGLFADFSRDSGFWRSTSFGMVALTARDFRAAGGFNTEIVGWGKEDVDLYERCLASGLQIFRAPDIGLVHVYHNKTCDNKLPPDQLSMCTGSKMMIFGSGPKLTEIAHDMERLP